MNSLTGFLPAELQTALNLKQSYRSRQVFSWLQKGVESFAEMSNLPAELRHKMEAQWVVSSSSIDQVWEDVDGTVKFRIRLGDNHFIETVLLCDFNERKTLCVSTQVGCKMGCLFCRTGQMTFGRNLAAAEIVEQLLLVSRQRGPLSHIVFMGMGEPLDNLSNVRQAISVLHHPEGIGLGLRKMTLSTCGLIRPLEDLAVGGPYVRLAVSLISALPAVREKLMPIARTQPLAELKKALLKFQKESGKRVTLEVVLIKGVNDGIEEITALEAFIPPLKAIINVIPWNPAAGLAWQRPENARVQWFTTRLEEKGFSVARRYRRGSGINAACGQLCPDQEV